MGLDRVGSAADQQRGPEIAAVRQDDMHVECQPALGQGGVQLRRRVAGGGRHVALDQRGMEVDAMPAGDQRQDGMALRRVLGAMGDGGSGHRRAGQAERAEQGEGADHPGAPGISSGRVPVRGTWSGSPAMRASRSCIRAAG
ncbi:MAG: hypothetical protein HLUCCA08_06400 [Rhodobacteraceae bacterium HLUCCA08]|nr:MAG: hypothetical protein HLUCCA08_06400 [Rhodobacteraceae bacterium HLUCCA08]